MSHNQFYQNISFDGLIENICPSWWALFQTVYSFWRKNNNIIQKGNLINKKSGCYYYYKKLPFKKVHLIKLTKKLSKFARSQQQTGQMPEKIEKWHDKPKGWGLSAKLGKHSAIWGKLGTALQAYTLSPCTKFPPNPTSRKVNT